MLDRIKALERELNAAKAEIEELRMRIGNITILLKREMHANDRLPDIIKAKAPDSD